MHDSVASSTPSASTLSSSSLQDKRGDGVVEEDKSIKTREKDARIGIDKKVESNPKGNAINDKTSRIKRSIKEGQGIITLSRNHVDKEYNEDEEEDGRFGMTPELVYASMVSDIRQVCPVNLLARVISKSGVKEGVSRTEASSSTRSQVSDEDHDDDDNTDSRVYRYIVTSNPSSSVSLVYFSSLVCRSCITSSDALSLFLSAAQTSSSCYMHNFFDVVVGG